MFLKNCEGRTETEMPWIGRDAIFQEKKDQKDDDPFARCLVTDTGKVIIAFIVAVTAGIVLIMEMCYLTEMPATGILSQKEERSVLRESVSITFNKKLSLFQGDVNRVLLGAGEQVNSRTFSAKIADAVVLKPSMEYSPSEGNRVILCALVITNTFDEELTLMPSENAFSARRIKMLEERLGLDKAEGKVKPGKSITIGLAFDAPEEDPVVLDISAMLYSQTGQNSAVLNIK